MDQEQCIKATIKYIFCPTKILDTQKRLPCLWEKNIFSNGTNANDKGGSIHWLTKICLYIHRYQIDRNFLDKEIQIQAMCFAQVKQNFLK